MNHFGQYSTFGILMNIFAKNPALRKSEKCSLAVILKNTTVDNKFYISHMKKGIIIGAGIGGLTTAFALLKKGIDITIYEQSKEINEVGAGIWIAPNGMKVFDYLGISQDILKAGKTLEKINVVDLNGKSISAIDGNKVKSKHKFATVAIHRATLQNILASYIPKNKIVLNKKFNSYQQTGNSVSATFEDGTIAEADFLINADGIKSNARLQIHADLNLRYSGQTCWRFVSEFDLPEAESGNMYEIWSNKKGLRVGYSKINDRLIYVFITNYERAGGKDNPKTIMDDLLMLCAEFPPVIKQMIQSTKGNGILRNDLCDFKPLKKWTDGKVALIGDAAHATTPNLGQGACQAIEDAYVIAQQLSINHEVEISFKYFEDKRIKKATYITNTSWQFGQITNTSGLLKSILMGVLRMTPNSLNNKLLDKVYSLEY
jgi:2-polyprenyl-6-methoxyphenol hydroxylase-like FAD-dependent oxidoreductase